MSHVFEVISCTVSRLHLAVLRLVWERIRWLGPNWKDDESDVRRRTRIASEHDPWIAAYSYPALTKFTFTFTCSITPPSL